MKNSILYSALALTLTVFTGCKGKTDHTAESAPAIDVEDVQVDSVVISQTYPGTLTALRKVDLVARVNGYLRSVNYKEGDLVKAGTLLFTIESNQYADAVNEAQGQLETAKSQLEYATQHYAAVKKALESEAVSQMEVNQAKSNAEQSEAAVKSAQAALNTARTNLGYCSVRAPFTGHVGAHIPSVGAYVGGAVSPVTLATIYEDDVLQAEFFIDDKTLQQILTGGADEKIDLDSIEMDFSTQLPHRYFGKLTYIAPAVDPSTGTLMVKATVKNPYNELHDGMYARIKLPLSSMQKAMLVRDASISNDQLGAYIYVVNDSNKVVYTSVTVGELANDSMRVVLSGVKPGDRYVTKALMKVRPDMIVDPVETPESKPGK